MPFWNKTSLNLMSLLELTELVSRNPTYPINFCHVLNFHVNDIWSPFCHVPMPLVSHIPTCHVIILSTYTVANPLSVKNSQISLLFSETYEIYYILETCCPDLSWRKLEVHWKCYGKAQTIAASQSVVWVFIKDVFLQLNICWYRCSKSWRKGV